MTGARERILVIKLGALGDMILAFAAFARIRAAHASARIILLTTGPYAELARAAPWFDEVWDDGRPRGLAAWLALIRRLRRASFARVYDLQTNDRTQLLFQTLRPFPPPWSGTAWGCGLPHRNRGRMRLHALERAADQLRHAGIWPDAPVAPQSSPSPDVGWMAQRAGPLAASPGDGPPVGELVAQASPLHSFGVTLPRSAGEEPIGSGRFGSLPVQRGEGSSLGAIWDHGSHPTQPLALLVPGVSPKRPSKRWPTERFGEIARRLGQAGWRVAVIGSADDAPLAETVRRLAPDAIDLTGRTDLFQLAALGQLAGLVLANDTGPAHLLAAAGAPSLVLFSADSDPALCAPRGRVSVVAAPDLADLPVETVWRAVRSRLDCGEGADHIAGRPFTSA